MLNKRPDYCKAILTTRVIESKIFVTNVNRRGEEDNSLQIYSKQLCITLMENYYLPFFAEIYIVIK
jgi:hypothetical protein